MTIVGFIVSATIVPMIIATIPYLVGGSTKYSVVSGWKQKLNVFTKSISMFYREQEKQE